MRVDPFGDSALIVTFDREISIEVNQRVIALYQKLKSNPTFNFLIPAYNSLTLGLSSNATSFEEASALIHQNYSELADQDQLITSSKTFVIPVCYAPDFSLDMDEVVLHTKISQEEIIEYHTSQVYHVYMLGFVAGFAYMGSLPKALDCPRKTTPRLKVPKGAVGLAGLQTGIYPAMAPGGWQIIGNTPIEMFNPENNPASVLQPGDSVKFRAIGKEEYRFIQLKIETDIFEMEIAHV
ncbi:5-oxoprolinase subunit PxpB [Roseivirga misakiensis]|uniref:Carboxyltransferase domain-containing protein n=1 Tax=Roseivirga misakiensis TaxID=1563681 RepID=A0A1E5T185_9BACT|nr:5-oxoprolinase subunit PxpB [Roseivirga misakiensis]OEK05134.1 hypothetical protein BFP71_17105 [Roseivirga misakiensis]